MRRRACVGVALTLTALLLSGCAGAGSASAPATPEDAFHWRPAEHPSGWAIFLPGSSGLTVFEDDHHYFDAAQRLNEQGWHVLLVDYKPAYRAVKHSTNRQTGEKIAWVTERATTWLRQHHPETADQPGAIVAWSLGAEGVFSIVNDPDLADSLGVRSAAVYYPSNKSDARLHNHIPLLILTGADDDVTPSASIESLVETRDPGSAPVELVVYPGCHHGFDIASIPDKKTLRILPLVGPKATLQYNEQAADDAWSRLTGFLNQRRTPTARERRAR